MTAMHAHWYACELVADRRRRYEDETGTWRLARLPRRRHRTKQAPIAEAMPLRRPAQRPASAPKAA